ncbi:PALP domain-containing protein [Staphylococcus hominis]|uniref:hypothetical protein n=1 Tax=Staphylococcus hominis TaxID=1290 RepID=UPI001642D54D|nr:hypothetical protein [Staphylococcus hominis]
MNQFESEDNGEAYRDTVGKEIREGLGEIDYFVGGGGCGGTFRGVGKDLEQFNVKNIIVEGEG